MSEDVADISVDGADVPAHVDCGSHAVA